MKKLSVFLAMLLMLCLVLPFSAMADGEEKMFWGTHFNDGFVEGSGVIYTETDTAGGWWIHVAFAPVEGVENTYEIVEMTNGLGDGSAAGVAVPEGGFVWASNYGNDYPTISGSGIVSHVGWADYIYDIYCVIVEEGITEIGDAIFKNHAKRLACKQGVFNTVFLFKF